MKFKEKLKKNIRKYIPVLCTLFLIPCISFNAFAYTFPLNSVAIKPDTGSNVAVIVKNPTWNEINTVYDAGEYSTEFNVKTSFYNVDVLGYMMQGANFTYNYNFDSYDYYIGFNVFFSSFDSSFDGSRMDIVCHNGAGSSYRLALTDYTDSLNAVSYPNHHYKVFSCLAKLPDTAPSSFNWFEVIGSGQLVASNYNEITAYLFEVPKGTDVEAVNSLISAINNQTSELGGKIDDTNDLIENGSSGTQSAITDFNDVFEDFNEELDNIEEFDNQIIGEFESANEQYLTELNNFSLSASLLNAGNWLSTSMQTVYDNSSDYKMLWLVPLLLGIPLIILFLKKGSDDE